MPLTWTNINGLKNCKNAFLFSFNFPWNTFLCFSRDPQCVWHETIFSPRVRKKLNCSTKKCPEIFHSFYENREKSGKNCWKSLYRTHVQHYTSGWCCLLLCFGFCIVNIHSALKNPDPYAVLHCETIKSSAFTVAGALVTCFCCFGSCPVSVETLLGDFSIWCWWKNNFWRKMWLV